MSTLTPNTPEPGWEKRWIKLALELVLRGPISFGVFALMFALSGLLGLLAIGAVNGFVSEYWAMVLGQTFSVIPLIGLYAWYTWRLFEMDTKISPNFAQAIWAARVVLPRTLIVISGFFIINFVLNIPESAASENYTDFIRLDFNTQDLGALLLVSVTQANLANTWLFLGLAWLTFHAFPLAVGMGMDEKSIRAFSKQMSKSKELKRVDSYFLCTALVLIVIDHTTGFFVIPLIVLFHAWAFVAMREIVGGIKDNQPDTAPSAEPNPT